METSTKIDLESIRRYPDTLDIYGTVLLDLSRSSLGRNICGLVPELSGSKGTGSNFSGEWVKELSNGGKKSKPHLIKIDGAERVLKVIPVGSGWAQYRPGDIFNLKDLRKSLEANADAANQCMGFVNFDYQYIGMDDFANETIVGSIVKEAFEEARAPKLYNSVDYASICGKYGVILTDYAENGDLFSFSRNLGDFAKLGNPNVIEPKVIATIIKQVGSSLDFLQEKVQFIHSDLKVQNVLISSKGVSGGHKGLSFNSTGYSARIADFGNASASLTSKNSFRPKKIRVFNEVRVTRYLPGGTANYKMKTQQKEECYKIELGSGRSGTSTGQCKESYWWKLPTSFNVKLSLITAHSGMPFYRSYDYYVFIITLMMCPSLYNGIMDDTRLKGRVWDSLWMAKDLEKVTRDVKSYHGKVPSLGKAIKVLKKYHMRCDGLQNSLELMKTY